MVLYVVPQETVPLIRRLPGRIPEAADFTAGFGSIAPQLLQGLFDPEFSKKVHDFY